VGRVGIRRGVIETVSDAELAGDHVIDATGLVVAPGFIDLHDHGQDESAYRLMVREGVTSAFELEEGTADVAAWYAARGGGQIVNYGVSVGHIPARMKVLRDPGTGLVPAGIGGSGAAGETELAAMEAILREALAQGAVAVGFGSACTPGAPMTEIERMFRVAAEGGAVAHIHMRGGLVGLQETMAAAAAARAPLHIVHVNSSAGDEIHEFLAAIEAARDAVTLMDALRRMSLEPARRLPARVAAMAKKGRLQPGADADITIFDADTVIDRATYEDGTIPSTGIPYVIVGGAVVVDRGEVTTARPGRAVRAPASGR
jgi:N-acyl-D-aspartate/D-glutamate deacylase